MRVSRPSLCWALLSYAARLSQAIGLHRNSNPSHFSSKAELEERKLVFWNIYILDKTFALTLGRTPVLPDYDVDVELPEDDGTNPCLKYFFALIGLAKVQNAIYMRLYSVSAGKQSDEEKDKAINELDGELEQWWEETRRVLEEESVREEKNQRKGKEKEQKSKDGGFEEAIRSIGDDGQDLLVALRRFVLLELRFSYLCNLTLVHRMAKPGSESEKVCLESARESIRVIDAVAKTCPEFLVNEMLLGCYLAFFSRPTRRGKANDFISTDSSVGTPSQRSLLSSPLSFEIPQLLPRARLTSL